MTLEPRDLRPGTDVDDAAVERVRARLSAELDPRMLRRALQALPGPPEGAEARVRARLDDAPSTPPLRLGRLIMAGLAAASLVGLSLVGTGLYLSAPSTPTPVDLDLTDAPASATDLDLRPSGAGHLGGTSAAPVLSWDAGAVELDATAPVVLATRELRATGQGRATLTRDALGTHLRVDAGRFDVDCLADDAPGAVGEGSGRLCRPVSADTMLGRVRALSATAAPTSLLDEIALGLSRDEGTEAARAELGVLRVATLDAAGRPEEALAAARAWLEDDTSLRRDEVQRLAAGLALALEGCSGALPHLRALADTDDEAAAALTSCSPGGSR